MYFALLNELLYIMIKKKKKKKKKKKNSSRASKINLTSKPGMMCLSCDSKDSIIQAAVTGT
jgi:hypothetical protein